MVGGMFSATMVHFGWREPPLSGAALDWILSSLLVGYALLFFVSARGMGGAARREFLKTTRPEQVVALGGLVMVWSPLALASASVLLGVMALLRFYLYLVQHRAIPPGLVFVGSFLGLTFAGAGLLMLPAATPVGMPISWLDALFTSTSAISQTGLVVRPTGEGFTRFGQVIIMIWIEVGALGVIVFGAMLANLLGSSFGLRATQTLAEGTEQGWSGQLSLQRLIAFIVTLTLTLNVIGAVVFYFSWPETWAGMPDDFVTTGDRIFHSVFFSVSSFCNAGFVTTSDSMQSLRTHYIPHLVIVPLIWLGSIGFPVLDDLVKTGWRRLRGVRKAEGKLVRLSLNTKIVLTAQVLLYVVGFSMIFAGELVQTEEPVRLVALDAHFMNVNRTSGFDTIAPGEMGLLSVLILIFLMFVGGSPGSVAGGIKVMVFSVLALTVIATIRGKSQTTAFGRTLPDEMVRKCAVIAVLSLVIVLGVTGVLALSEAGKVTLGVTELLFEATSAFATTGLSLGITDSLTPVSKVAICIAMLVGRVGPLAVLAGLFSMARRSSASYAYPTEDVVVY